MEKTNNKKRYGVIAVVLVALLAAGVGTWAWLQATDQVKNEFTVGKITEPDKKPDGTDPGNEPHLKGYLFETEWQPDSKMVPDTDIKKNPNVGIGAGSDSSYVFIYVKNAIVKTDTTDALAKTPYFTINTGWKPVDGQVTTNGTPGQYVSGLFMYTAGGTGAPTVLAPTDGNAYTGELFDTVHIPAAMNSTDVVEKPAMTVSCYIFGADQGGADNALTQAKAWAEKQAQ
ncbi:SipW-dependent-type signal peptide-containing protein [uncultured Senegalimassilia sp.]|uniref:SipW-dependent-type signal peptide-containing protein n=1 Tax=uncultured Senegalimassilia sp. TaxID=1714350 RepID=UPI002600FAA4|nr:SipW-dependent-type signal peptide-containing protein [uncultured Senegalimassilia sp.]